MMAAAHSDRPTLGDLAGDQVPPQWRAVPIAGLALNSDQVAPGFAFIALRGDVSDGLDYVSAAVAAGAAVVLYEPRKQRPAQVDNVPMIALDQLRERVGDIADRFYGSPSSQLTIAGITGTNGKTTVARLIAMAAAQCGVACGVSGTLGFGRPGALRPSKLTTPDAVVLQSQLAEIVAGGATHAAIEVSSHALAQQRAVGTRFDTAVFTNLTRDHLDYHGSMDRYLDAKRRLFHWPGLARAIINVDDPVGLQLATGYRHSRLTVVGGTAAVAGFDRCVAIAAVDSSSEGISVAIDYQGQRLVIKSPLLGRFNADNLALAFAVLTAWGVAAPQAAEALATVSAPPGRMESFGGVDRALVVVDYAHTPDALENALTALREHCSGQLWVVFGCGGERDAGKRPLMGEIAARCADRVVVTDDNPRREDPQAIIDAIVGGAGGATTVLAQRGRREAIARAVAAARAGDVVLVAGKGHEDYQVIGERRIAYSDRDEVMRLVGGAR